MADHDPWDPPVQLTLRWRRLLVALSAVALATLLIMRRLPGEAPPTVYHSVSLVAAFLVLCSLWLLADTFRPWLSDDGVGPRERLRADAALRRSYLLLLCIAVVALVTQQVTGIGPQRATAEHPELVLWSVFILVAGLPLAILACSAGDDAERTLGPRALIARRFTGPARRMYALGLWMLCATPVLLLIGLRLPGGRLGGSLAALVGLGSVAAAAAYLLLHLLAARRGGSHDRR